MELHIVFLFYSEMKSSSECSLLCKGLSIYSQELEIYSERWNWETAVIPAEGDAGGPMKEEVQ